MTRLVLRLLLIASLVMNGAGASWAMVEASVEGDGHGHHQTAMVQQHASTDAAAASDCHHGEHRPDHASPVPAADGDAATAHPDRSCCDGTHCACGCMLPPMLARLALQLPARTWTAAPVGEPTIRVVVRRAPPPFRPPAA